MSERVPAPWNERVAAPINARVDVAVIGAGVSGLAAALGAERAGATVVVLEASNRVGGVVRTSVVNDFLVEHGPNSFAATDASMALVKELNIESDVLRPSPQAKLRFVVKHGVLRALPQSPPSIFTTKLLSWRGKMRALAEVFVARGGSPEESLASLVRRRFGSEVLDYMVDPFVSGVYAGDPELLSSHYAMRMLFELEQQYGSVLRGAVGAARARRKNGSGSARGHIISFRNGLEQLPQAMARALRAPVRLQTTVTTLAQNDAGWLVTYTDTEGSHTLYASALVVAVPAHRLHAIEWPATAREDVSVLQSVPHASVATVALGFSRDSIGHPLNGFGMLVPHVEHRDILGALFNSTLFPGRAPETQSLLTVFIGGARSEPLAPNDAVLYTALCELQALLDTSALPTMSLVTRWDDGIPQFVIGHERVLAAARALEAAHKGLVFTGSYLRGVSLGDCVANGLAAGKQAAVPG